MNKITKNIAALIAFGIGTTTVSFAQVTQQKIGNNPTLINPNAALEVESTTKGLLLPRLGLSATNNFAPLLAHVAGMTVYNTATAGTAPNNVTPGYYYNDGTQWVRIATGADAKTEPWRVENSTTEATLNNQNIYQNGNVGIGNFSTTTATQRLDIASGNVRVRDINLPANAGVLTDKIVVADATTGVLKTVERTTFAADVRRIGTNHISEDAGVGSNGTTMPGTNNIAIGAGAMNAAVATGAPFGFLGNVAIGGGNQLANVNGDGSVAVGYGNLPLATTGNNVAVGGLNLTRATTGNANYVLGSQNLSNLTTGGSNAAMGINNLTALTSGGSNHVFGHNSLQAITTQNQNIAIGSEVLKTAVGDKNIGVGSTSLLVLGAGQDNIAFGVNAGGAMTTGNYNTFFGTEAGNRLAGSSTERYTSGNYSLFLGSQVKAKNAVNNQLNIGNWIYGENGSIALGNFTGATALPTITSTVRLDVVTGDVKVRTLNTTPYTLVATDKVVVANTDGTLRSIASTAFATNNIYTANGTLGANRTVTMDGKTLNFVNGTESILFNPVSAGVSSQNITGADRGNLTLTGGGAIVDLYVDSSAAAQLTVRGTATSMNVGTTTGQAKPLNLVTNGLTRATVTATGEMAIGATSAPSFTVGATTIQPKLHVAGDISTTGKVWTTNSVYADYVFEKYFKGSSDINPNYEFKSLNYVKDFIKANNHLPGVESINDLAKAENGYTFDMTKLTIQSLEKIEELYLHTIEQQDKIDAQQAEIEKLKEQSAKTNERLERLESLINK